MNEKKICNLCTDALAVSNKTFVKLIKAQFAKPKNLLKKCNIEVE